MNHLLGPIQKANTQVDLKNYEPAEQRAFWHIALWLYASDELMLGEGKDCSTMPGDDPTAPTSAWQWLKSALPHAEKFEEDLDKLAQEKEEPREKPPKRPLHGKFNPRQHAVLEVVRGLGEGGFWPANFKTFSWRLCEVYFDFVRAACTSEAVRLAHEFGGFIGADLRTVALYRGTLCETLHSHLHALTEDRHHGGVELTHTVGAHFFWLALHKLDLENVVAPDWAARAGDYFADHLFDPEHTFVRLSDRVRHRDNWHYLCGLLCEIYGQLAFGATEPMSDEDISHILWRTFCFFLVHVNTDHIAARRIWKLCISDDRLGSLGRTELETYIYQYRPSNVGESGARESHGNPDYHSVAFKETNAFLDMLLTESAILDKTTQAHILIETARYSLQTKIMLTPAQKREQKLLEGVYWTNNSSTPDMWWRRGYACECPHLRDVTTLTETPQYKLATKLTNSKNPEILGVMARGALCQSDGSCHKPPPPPSLVKDKGISVLPRVAPLVDDVERGRAKHSSFHMLDPKPNRSCEAHGQKVPYLPVLFCERLEALEARWLGLRKRSDRRYVAGCFDDVARDRYICMTRGLPTTTPPLRIHVPLLNDDMKDLSETAWQTMAADSYMPPIELLPLREDNGCVCGEDSELADSRALFGTRGAERELRAYRFMRNSQPSVISASWTDLIPANLPVGVGRAAALSPQPDYARSPTPAQAVDRQPILSLP